MDVVRQIRISAPGLGQRVLALRLAHEDNAQYLATRAGISTAYWYQIESERRSYISEEILRGIEKALGVDLGVNFDG